MGYLFTSESVSEGHPDKICDQVSDAILDTILAQDPASRVACETFTTTGLVVVGGEITTTAKFDVSDVVRQTLRNIGYTDPAFGIDADSCAVLSSLHSQSPDIAQGVNEGEGLYSAQGAGDQGLMFGYACNQTPELMPLPISLAHRLVKRLADLRKSGELPYLRPDSKSQVTIEYDGFTPVRVDTVVISTQHSPDVAYETLKKDVIEKVIRPIMPEKLMDDKVKFYINPTGRFVIGGPHGDAGLTGRKIIVDTYGGWARHGGGAFSGKDSTKVDRSAAYMARYVAKNIVAAGLATEVEIQLAYAIGVAEPVSVHVDTHGTGKINDSIISEIVRDVFDLTPAGIIRHLDLRKPIFLQTAAYGHFGRTDTNFTWEKVDQAEILQQKAGSKTALNV